jgi:hypothetical protein
MMVIDQFFDTDSEIDVWGWPWHGLAQKSSTSPLDASSTLTLPNSATRTIRAPNYPVANGNSRPAPDSYGDSFLCKVPGVAAVTRTIEQEALDAEIGAEWRNDAILYGGRLTLYDTPLDGWIYTDSTGARWLIKCPQFINTQAATSSWTVTATLFGDFDADAASASFTVTPPASAKYRLISTSPDGSEAIISRGHGPLTGWWKYSLPVAFYKLTVSGTAGSLAMNLTELKSAAETSVRDYGSVSRSFVTNGFKSWLVSDGVSTFSITQIIGMWHKPDGTIVQCALKTHGDYEEHNPNWSDSGVAGQVHSVSATGSIDLMLDASVVYSTAFSASIEIDFTGDPAVKTWALSGFGYNYSGTQSATNPGWYRHGTTSIWDLIQNLSPYINTHGSGLNDGATDESMAEITNGTPAFVISPQYHSAQVAGFNLTILNLFESTLIQGRKISPVATPTGGAGSGMTDKDYSATDIYGAWNPHTSQVVHGQSLPVCWV